MKYWYLLEEVTSTGPNTVGKISAGIDVPTDTPTTTPTVRPTATRTSAPAGGITPTKPAPTATQKYTNTPVISPLGTPTRPPATASAPGASADGHAAARGGIATPTGRGAGGRRAGRRAADRGLGPADAPACGDRLGAISVAHT